MTYVSVGLVFHAHLGVYKQSSAKHFHHVNTKLDLAEDDLIKIDASNSSQPCASFGVNKMIGQDFVDLYNAGEVIFVASK